MAANDTQHGGDHYRKQTMQHWDMVHICELDYFRGNITKYLSRYKEKGGVLDLRKALHFAKKREELKIPSPLMHPQVFADWARQVSNGDKKLEAALLNASRGFYASLCSDIADLIEIQLAVENNRD